MSTAAELKKANEMTNFKKYKAKIFEALANDTYGLTVSQLATVCKLSSKTIKQILAELDVEKTGDVYLLMTKQPSPSAPHFPIYDNWLSKNMTTLRQATAHLSNNDVNDIIEVAGRLIWEASKNQLDADWISVKEQLPDIETDVLVLFKGNIIQAGLYKDDEGLAWWSELLDGWDLDFERVTHWKPQITLPFQFGAKK
ncbi:DUF551 domain-containing protein [Acinetobacter pittii]|uniref:DUF551 domain-containing protein n=1 Tax=Acinetobacter pittii TaxID=48296 RepID=UPI00301DA37F